MGCARNIRTELAEYPAGGTWLYVGYSTSSGGPFTSTAAIPVIPEPNNTSLSNRGDNFAIDTAGKTPGYYKFQYTLSGNTYDFILRVIDRAVDAGGDGAVSFSTAEVATINLINFIDPSSSSGTWSVKSGSPGANFNAGAGTLNLTGLAAGVYEFKYSYLDPGFTDKSCFDCNRLEAVLQVTMTTALVVKITSTTNGITCVSELVFKHPSNNTVNEASLVLPANATEGKLVMNMEVYKCGHYAKLGINQELANGIKAFVAVSSNFLTNGTASGFVLPANSFVTSIVVQNSSNGNLVTIPVAPTTATLSGGSGTITGSDLILNAVTESNFANNLMIAFKNRAVLEGLTLDNVKDFSFEVGGSANSNYYIQLGSFAPYNPSATVYGVHSFTVDVSGTTTTFTMSANKVLTKQYNLLVIKELFDNPCVGTLEARLFTASVDAIIDSTTVYSGMVLTTNWQDLRHAVLFSNSYVRSKTCAATQLTAVVSNCDAPNTPTYRWTHNDGEQTTQSITVFAPGLFSVTALCNGLDAYDEITLP